MNDFDSGHDKPQDIQEKINNVRGNLEKYTNIRYGDAFLTFLLENNPSLFAKYHDLDQPKEGGQGKLSQTLDDLLKANYSAYRGREKKDQEEKKSTAPEIEKETPQKPELTFLIDKGDTLYTKLASELENKTGKNSEKDALAIIKELYKKKGEIAGNFNPDLVESTDNIGLTFENDKVIFCFGSAVQGVNGCATLNVKTAIGDAATADTGKDVLNKNVDLTRAQKVEKVKKTLLVKNGLGFNHIYEVQKKISEPLESLVSRYSDAIVRAMEINDVEFNDDSLAIVLTLMAREGGFFENPLIPEASKMYERYRASAMKKVDEKLDSAHAPKFVRDGVNSLIETYEQKYKQKFLSCSSEGDIEQVVAELKAEIENDQSVKNLERLPVFGSSIKGYLDEALKILADPVKTIGVMQVDFEKAVEISRKRGERLSRDELRKKLYTVDGNLEYGLALIREPVKVYLEEKKGSVDNVFADYNTGSFSSRNAEIQDILNQLSPDKQQLVLDGDLLIYDESDAAKSNVSNTEARIRLLRDEYGLPIDNLQIRKDLLVEKSRDFDNTLTSKSLREQYKKKFSQEAPYARLPQITLKGTDKFGASTITTQSYVTGSKSVHSKIRRDIV